jgi:hypothetical protein
MAVIQIDLVRFRDKVASPPDGASYYRHCWIWTGAKNAKGYGRFWWHGRLHLAHRWAYERVNGPIPVGLVIDHICNQPSCVNPNHLEVATRGHNVLREGSKAPSRVNALKTECIHGHLFTKENTYVKSDGRRDCRACNRDRARKRAAAERSDA